MKLYLAPELERTWAGHDPFAAVQALQGEVYRHMDGRTTLRFEREGQGYFAKIHRGIEWGEIAKNLLFFRLPVMGAENEWRAIGRLREMGVDTMTAVGFGSRGWWPSRRLSFLVTRALEPATDLETWCRRHLAELSVRDRRRLARRLAEITRTLTDHGINHRDYYLCHFLVDESSAEGEKPVYRRPLYLIDLHRVQQRRRVPRRWLLKDLAGLYYSARLVGFDDRDALAFWRTYAGRENPRAFWRAVRRRARALHRKGERKGYHTETEDRP